MRHNVYGKKLSRTKNQRAALFKGLVSALILHGSIQTTETKAKAIKGLVDKIVNQAKSKDTQRLLQTYFSQKSVVEKLTKEVAPALKSRNSGYTSTVRLGNRLGDNAMVVRMSLLMDEVKKEAKEPKVETVEEEVKEEAEKPKRKAAK